MWSLSRFDTFDRDKLGFIGLTRVKDREGWLPQRVNFSIGGDGKGEFVFARSAGTVEIEGDDGLKNSERKSLEALETFGEKGARTGEWQKKAAEMHVARRTFYNARASLVEKCHVMQEKDRYYVRGALRCRRCNAPGCTRELRDEYGDEMARCFRDLCREELEDGGGLGLVALWARTLPELLYTALKERSTMLIRNAYRAAIGVATRGSIHPRLDEPCRWRHRG